MKKLFFFFLLLLFLLSYFREITFIGINAIIDGQAHNYANTQLPAFFYKLDVSELSTLKWYLTAAFSLLFMVLSLLGIGLSLGKKQSFWLLLLYALIVLLFILISLFGIFFSDFRTIYPFIRLLIGVIHSPLLFLVISISAYAIKNK